MTKRFLLSLAVFVLTTAFHSLLAQNKSVSGVVTDAEGVPLPGVSVMVKSTTRGVATDFEGQYRIDAAQGEVLVFSSIGFISQEISVGGGNSLTINVLLKEDTQQLDEVVIVGFGVQKKVNLTGSVATIDNKLLESRPMTSVSSGLAGLLPGVSIRQSSGLPGGDGATIRVRGIGTLNNSNPMVLVDGVESSMNEINPNDIASISVLKDAASAAIYGSKAANGVVLITTKSGKKDTFTVNYAASVGYQAPTQLPEYMSSAEYATIYKDAGSTRFTDADIELFRNGTSPYTHPNTDWLDLLYSGSGLLYNHDLSFSGGNEKSTYRASIGHQNQDGIIKYTGKKQYNARLNLVMTPKKWLTGTMNMSFTRQNLEEPNNSYVGGGLDQIVRQTYRIAPWIPYRNEDGTYGTISDGNPIAWIDQGAQLKKRRDYFLGIGSLEIRPIEDLRIKGLMSLRTYNQDYNEKNNEIQYNPTKYQGPTKLSIYSDFDQRFITDFTVDYSKTFGIHTLSALAGYHMETYNFKRTYAYRENFPSTSLEDLNGGSTQGMKAEGYTRELNMISYFGRLNYSILDRYLFEANLRYDASSRFAKENRWGSFPSLSAAWRISEEAFFENARETFNNVKVRASWGKLGNQDALDSGNTAYYPTVPTLSLGYDYPFNSTIVSGAAIAEARNRNLKWEGLETWGIGLDLGIKNKINVTLDYYDKQTTGIIMNVPAPETFALSNYYDNVGRVSNKGIELMVDYRDTFGEFDLNLSGNVSYNKNELLELAGTNEIITGRYIRRIGNPIDAFYGYKTDGLYRTAADLTEWAPNRVGAVQLGDLRYVDVDGDNQITTADRTILGSSFPKYHFGFNIGLGYKNFDFLAIFQGTLGGYGYMDFDAVGGANGDAQKPNVLWRDRWTPDNVNASVPRLPVGTVAATSMPQNNTLEYWLRSTDYLRLKSLQVGYNLPQNVLEKFQISSLRLYYSGQNLLTITDYLKGFDPEAPSGRGSGYPVVMINSIGLSVTF
ncbi:MAG: TonB-dependent receptor [Capnocytophaga sp.]|nr:TonB-dependent receptor [Capnocytophaga sp.]